MQNFDGQIAVVTGGAQGIGAEVVSSLAQRGARVAIWDKDIELARETAAKLGDSCSAFMVEVDAWDSVQLAYQNTVNELGAVSLLVNSAGIAGSNTSVQHYGVDEFRDIVAVNLLGTST